MNNFIDVFQFSMLLLQLFVHTSARPENETTVIVSPMFGKDKNLEEVHKPTLTSETHRLQHPVQKEEGENLPEFNLFCCT